jgi:alkylated DNA repair dioxygenase AlkB
MQTKGDLKNVIILMPPTNLFNPDPKINLLPCDGTVHYFGPILSAAETHLNFEELLKNIEWRNDETVIFGRRIITARKVAWYGDSPFSYTYSGTAKEALAWTDELLALRSVVENLTGERFNSCLLNLYHHGGEGMGWHSDDEKTIVKDSAIASLSFGAERKFSFRHRQTKETVSLILENGSLLLMKDTTQTHWQHQLSKSKRIASPRINLTFRRMMESA